MKPAFTMIAWALGVVLPVGGQAAAAGPDPQPASRPATPAAGTSPATPASEPVADPAAKVLRLMEQAGQKYATIEADVVHRVLMRMVGDVEERTGQVAFARQTDSQPARFYIRFDTLRQGSGPKLDDKVEYAFDGQWLTEAKHRIQSMKRYQVVPEGQQADPLKLGKGPFPVPFGQKTDEVLKYFEVSTRPPAAGDPNGADYIQLITRPAYREELSFLSCQMWVDRATGLPVKLISENRNKEQTTVLFSHVKTDTKVDDKLFRSPFRAGWHYEVVPLDKGGPAGGPR